MRRTLPVANHRLNDGIRRPRLDDLGERREILIEKDEYGLGRVGPMARVG
jgi:hypothetical protein